MNFEKFITGLTTTKCIGENAASNFTKVYTIRVAKSNKIARCNAIKSTRVVNI